MQNGEVKRSFLLLTLLTHAQAQDVAGTAPLVASVGQSSFAFAGEPQVAQGEVWTALSQLSPSRWSTVEVLRFSAPSSEGLPFWFLAPSFSAPSLELYTYAPDKRRAFLLPALKEVQACGIPYHTLVFNHLSVKVRC